MEAVCVTGPNLPQPIGLVLLNVEAHHTLLTQADHAMLESEFQVLLDCVNADLAPP